MDQRLPEVAGGWELQQGPHARLWVPKQPDALLDHEAHVERHEYHGSMPYWAWIWDSVEPCVDGLLQREVTGRVLELGAGLGAAGISLALQRRGHVTCTLSDNDPLAVRAMEVNVELNGLDDTRVWSLDWRNLNRLPSDAKAERFDVLLGCEVIYDPTSHAALLDVVHHFLNRSPVGPPGRALIFDPGRKPAKQFVRRARERGFTVQVEDLAGRPAEVALSEPRWLTLRRACCA